MRSVRDMASPNDEGMGEEHTNSYKFGAPPLALRREAL